MGPHRLTANADGIKGQWKKSKRVLIERIRSFGEYSNYDHRLSVTENEAIKNAKTISDLVKSLIKTDLNYSEIVRMVRDRFPSSATTTRSVASTASRLRKNVANDVHY